MSRKVYFDMDGTLFDLYGKSNWLEMLRTETSGAFVGDFLPEIDKDKFYTICNELLAIGVQIGIISWLPMQASPEYEEICRIEKMEWISKNLPFVSEINIVSYGILKQSCIKKRATEMYLIDDNAEICQMWQTAKQRKAINICKEYTVVEALEDIYNSIMERE